MYIGHVRCIHISDLVPESLVQICRVCRAGNAVAGTQVPHCCAQNVFSFAGTKVMHVGCPEWQCPLGDSALYVHGAPRGWQRGDLHCWPRCHVHGCSWSQNRSQQITAPTFSNPYCPHHWKG